RANRQRDQRRLIAAPRMLESSSDRDEQAKGDAERLLVLAAEVVGVARLDEPAVLPLGRRPNLHIDQRHSAKGASVLAMTRRVEPGGSNTGHDLQFVGQLKGLFENKLGVPVRAAGAEKR